ncbi:MAG: glycogen-binding domain-containing protein [Acidobacteria bacterium]|nr:glycogen-binding domain-containing protein [Acidobacteriota bacterium]
MSDATPKEKKTKKAATPKVEKPVKTAPAKAKTTKPAAEKTAKAPAKPKAAAPAKKVAAKPKAATAEKKVEKKPATQKVSIQFRAEPGSKVAVAGNFNGWNPREFYLTEGEQGLFQIELELVPGEYEYKMVVNGKWQADPAAESWIPNPFGSLNSVLKV